MKANDHRVFVVEFPRMDSKITVQFYYGDSQREERYNLDGLIPQPPDSTVTAVDFLIEQPMPPMMQDLNRAYGVLNNYEFTDYHGIAPRIREALYNMHIAQTCSQSHAQFSGRGPTLAFPRERAHVLSIKESLLRIAEERAAEIEAEENAIVHHTAVGVAAVAIQYLINFLSAKAST